MHCEIKDSRRARTKDRVGENVQGRGRNKQDSPWSNGAYQDRYAIRLIRCGELISAVEGSTGVLGTAMLWCNALCEYMMLNGIECEVKVGHGDGKCGQAGVESRVKAS